MAQLQLKNVNKAFGNTQVIRDVDLEIEPGEFVVFVGPSGVEIYTFRLIAGLEQLTSGEIMIAGRAVMDRHPQSAVSPCSSVICALPAATVLIIWLFR